MVTLISMSRFYVDPVNRFVSWTTEAGCVLLFWEMLRHVKNNAICGDWGVSLALLVQLLDVTLLCVRSIISCVWCPSVTAQLFMLILSGRGRAYYGQ